MDEKYPMQVFHENELIYFGILVFICLHDISTLHWDDATWA